MRIVIIGYGWVGQANALALAHLGNEVGFFDVSPSVTEHYKNGSQGALYKSIARLSEPLAWEASRPAYIVCVGDRVDFATGVQDITAIKKALDAIKSATGRRILRSTILPEHLSTLAFDFYLPEFLHEKFAVEECINPYYFVVGTTDATLHEPHFFKEWERRAYRVFRGTPGEASLVKYLSNIWNATRIAFTNEFGSVIGDPANPKEVDRINHVLDFVLERKSYQRYGRAFDGHCLPKDTRSFIRSADDIRKEVPLLKGVYASNALHAKRLEAISEATVAKQFSGWDPHVGVKSSTQRAEEWVRKNRMLVPFHPLLRACKQMLEAVFPAPSLSKLQKIWNEKGKENPLYYMNTKTRSGPMVSEAEFLETGTNDYARYIERDPRLHATLPRFTKHTVLEIGCGIGRMTRLFAEHFDTVIGVDIAPSVLAEGRKRLASCANVTLKDTNGITLPVTDQSVTFLFSYLTLQHLPNMQAVDAILREIARVLVKGGIAKIQLRTGKGIPKWRWSYGVALSPAEAIRHVERVDLRVLEHSVDDTKNLWLTIERL